MATEVAVAPRRAPVSSQGLWGWLRTNLFNGLGNSVITLVMAVLAAWAITSFFRWLLTTPGWPAVLANLRLFSTYLYPVAQVWRVELAVWVIAGLLGLSAGVWKGLLRGLAAALALLFALATVLPLAAPPSGNDYAIPPLAFLLGGIALIGLGYVIGLRGGRTLRWPLAVAWPLAFPLLMLGLIYGVGPLPDVPTLAWGGFLVTMTLTIVGIVGSFPLGVLLALGRRSKLPIVRLACTAYIEVVRGVPLITVLFMAQFLLPLFLPPSGAIRIDNLVRAMVAVVLFSAAYLAENVRGGLQSLPKGQYEAAHALGLNYVQTTLLITLPQALRAVIPALVGQFISLFKDTSLVSVIGLFDLLTMTEVVQSQPQWLSIPGGVWRETLFFVGLIYFIFSFTMSRVSQRIERNLGVGRR